MHAIPYGRRHLSPDSQSPDGVKVSGDRCCVTPLGGAVHLVS